MHFPSNLSEGDDHVKAQAALNVLKVVEKRTVLKKESFRDIMMGGNENEILEFLEKEPLNTGEKEFKMDDLMFLLKKKSFYQKVVAILRNRRFYSEQVWNWAFEHDDTPTMQERFQQFAR